MKNLKFFALLLAFFLVLPLAVFADEATEESKEVNVYLFRGEGCPHCAEAEEWFKSIEEEYGDLFNVVDYETWYDEENAELMQRVADAREEKAEGVPYIIIGNKSWNGFAESYEKEMLDEIKSVFEQDVSDRYDIMELLPKINKDKEEKESAGGDVLALIIILVVAGGLGFGVYKARKAN